MGFQPMIFEDMRRISILSFIVSSLIFFELFFLQSQVYGIGGLSISPALIERDTSPGEVLSLNIKVSNFDMEGTTVYRSTADFTGDPNEGGTPYFIENPDSTAFSTWVQLSENQLFINAEERIEIPFTIRVPEDAEPGGHYGAIIISTENPRLEAGVPMVGATSEIGTLLLTKVAGEVIEQGRTLSFKTSKTLYQQPPVIFEIRFENMGNVHTKPTGVIEIFNSVGIKEEVLQINRAFGSVLPGTTRKFEEKWEPGKWLNIIPRMGKYKAEALLTYGLPSTTEDLGAVTFWLIPGKFLAKVAGVIVAILFILRLLLRSYTRSVISRHSRRRRK